MTETKRISYETTPEYERDLAKLTRRFRTLEEDIEIAKVAGIELLLLYNIDNNGSFLLQGYPSDKIKFYKLKKLACRSLKGKGIQSGLRLIYAYLPKENKVVLIELYYKADKPSEDKTRLTQYFSKIS